MKITFKYIGIVLSVILPIVTLMYLNNIYLGHPYGWLCAVFMAVFWFAYLLNQKFIRL